MKDILLKYLMHLIWTALIVYAVYTGWLNKTDIIEKVNLPW